MNAADFALADAAPNLRQNMLLGEGRRSSKASFGVSDVLGELDVDEVESFLHKACKAEVLNVDASSKSYPSFDLSTIRTSVSLNMLPTILTPGPITSRLFSSC